MSGPGPALTAQHPEFPAAAQFEGRTVLAIPVGMSRSDFALAKLAGVRGSAGWIVRAEAVEPWRVEGFFRQEGRLCLYGPYLPGRLLEQELAGSGSPAEAQGVNGVRALRRVIQALLTLQGQRADQAPGGHEANVSGVEELQTDAVS